MKSWLRHGVGLGLAASVLLHLGVLAGPAWVAWRGLATVEENEPLSATLLPPAATVMPVKPLSVPGKPAARPRPAAVIGAEAASVPGAISEAATRASAQEDAAAVDGVGKPASAGRGEVSDTNNIGGEGAGDGAVPEGEAPPLPLRGQIRYTVVKGEGGFEIGRSVHVWKRDGRRYQISATTETTGIAALFKKVKTVQESEGGFVRGELKPATFREDKGEGEVENASFDWGNALVRFGNGQSQPIGEGAEDRLSMFYQLLQAAQRGQGFVMAVANGRKLERYAFEWLGEEPVSVPAGRFQAWHIRVKAATGSSDTLEVWLGKEVASLPVKIRHTDRKGERFELNADELNYEGK